MPTYLDNTMLSTYKDCPRKYFIRHVLGWRSTGVATPLAFGLAWHSGMDVVWQNAKTVSMQDLPKYARAAFEQTWEEQGMSTDLDVNEVAQLEPRTPSIAHEMFVEYIASRWKILQEAELLACEQPFAVPLPETEDTWYIGRLDKVVVYQGQKQVIEHKTTTEYKVDGGFRSTFVESWYSDSQIKGYQYGGNMFFPGLREVWVDAALVHKKVHNAFRFIPVAHSQPLLYEWVEGTRTWVSRLQADTEAYNHLGLSPSVFPKNEGSCMGKYGPCTFLNICRTISDPTTLDGPPEGYMEERWEPFKVLGLDKLINPTPEHG